MILPTVLTVLRVGFSCDALIRMIRAPARHSRLNAISIPSVRRDVCPSTELCVDRVDG